jgi:hypothetical protein
VGIPVHSGEVDHRFPTELGHLGTAQVLAHGRR